MIQFKATKNSEKTNKYFQTQGLNISNQDDVDRNTAFGSVTK